MEGAPSTEQRAVLAVTGKSSISLNGNLVEMNELAAALESLKREKPDVKLQLDVDQKGWRIWRHCRHLGRADVCGY